MKTQVVVMRMRMRNHAFSLIFIPLSFQSLNQSFQKDRKLFCRNLFAFVFSFCHV